MSEQTLPNQLNATPRIANFLVLINVLFQIAQREIVPVKRVSFNARDVRMPAYVGRACMDARCYTSS